MARYRSSYGYGYGGWAPYVSVGQRRRQAASKMNALRKSGVDVQPVVIYGRKIAYSFWGEAWCEHLESYSDYENRLPRGRTYVRNGSVCHLAISTGRVEAKVCGSDLYTVTVSIKPLPATKWTTIKKRSSGQIGSLLELLQGKLSDHVMELVTDRKDGLFPAPSEISLKCSCPDSAYMCKHVAAVLYGVGARLDSKPELLFTLRGVNHEELIAANAESAVATATTRGQGKRLATSELGDVFGIELQDATTSKPVRSRGRKKTVEVLSKADEPGNSGATASSPRPSSLKKTAATTAAAEKPPQRTPRKKSTPADKPPATTTPAKKVRATKAAKKKSRATEDRATKSPPKKTRPQ